MKPLDHLIRRWRISVAGRHIPDGARVLDIGCGDGALFRLLKGRIREGIGIEPGLAQSEERGLYRLMAGAFPDPRLDQEAPFDAITMLAVLEHIPDESLDAVSRSCAGLLKPGGRLVLTVPSPHVDRILHALIRVGLMDGQEAHQHHGFDVRRTPSIFSRQGLRLISAKKFQLGLNNLFVFEKPPGQSATAGDHA
jgi:SAM-dependent methyltransferase